MAFKYINPGYSALLNDFSNAGDIVNPEYSDTGTAFFNIGENSGVIVPSFPSNKEFWAKFDFYAPMSGTWNIALLCPGAYDNNKYGLRIRADANYVYVEMANGVNNTQYSSANKSCQITKGLSQIHSTTGVMLGAKNTVWMHYVYGGSGYMEVRVNDVLLTRYANLRVFEWYNANYLLTYIYATNNSPLSSLILSDEEISTKEQIIALPTSATVTDMTAGENGIYIADAVNQTLLQSVDVSTLVETYGASSAVTGISLVGKPAYTTGTGLASLIGIEKSNDTSIVEHGTCDLSDDTIAGIVTSWSVNNVTIADLQGMQFGWKVGE